MQPCKMRLAQILCSAAEACNLLTSLWPITRILQETIDGSAVQQQLHSYADLGGIRQTAFTSSRPTGVILV